MKNLFVIVMLIFSANTLFAQIQFRQGYVITLTGDTLFGEIDYQDNDVLARQCRFRENPQSQSQIFTPFDIAGYRFTDGKYFISKNIDNTQYFVEYLLNGVINLYTLHDEKKATHFYIEKEGIGLNEIPYENKVLRVEDANYAFSTTKHIGILQYYMQDAGELNSQIATIKEPTRRNLLKLTENYHNVVCDSVSCIIYEKKMQRVRVNPQLIFGATHLSGKAIPDKNLYMPTYGLLCHISFPFASDKIYLKTGFFNFLYKNTSYCVIPLQLEYIYPIGVVRPRISAGLNLTGFPFTRFEPAISTGLWFMVNKKISITADYDLGFNNFFAIGGSNYLLHTVYAGIRIDI